MRALRCESVFSQAVDPRSARRGNLVRPKKIGESLDAIMGSASDDDVDEEIGQEEARAIAGQKAIYQPSAEEWDEHMRTHIPFRKWCPYCVKAKSKSAVHKRSIKSAADVEKEVPVIAWDYMGPKSKEDKKGQIDSLPILVGVDRRSKRIFAHMVPKKGHDAHAIKMAGREVEMSGYGRMILKSDQEPSIKELLRAVKRERAEDIEVLMEESPVGEHASNGAVEKAIQDVQAQIRTMRLAVQGRYKCNLRNDHPIMP